MESIDLNTRSRSAIESDIEAFKESLKSLTTIAQQHLREMQNARAEMQALLSTERFNAVIAKDLVFTAQKHELLQKWLDEKYAQRHEALIRLDELQLELENAPESRDNTPEPAEPSTPITAPTTTPSSPPRMTRNSIDIAQEEPTTPMPGDALVPGPWIRVGRRRQRDEDPKEEVEEEIELEQPKRPNPAERNAAQYTVLISGPAYRVQEELSYNGNPVIGYRLFGPPYWNMIPMNACACARDEEGRTMCRGDPFCGGLVRNTTPVPIIFWPSESTEMKHGFMNPPIPLASPSVTTVQRTSAYNDGNCIICIEKLPMVYCSFPCGHVTCVACVTDYLKKYPWTRLDAFVKRINEYKLDESQLKEELETYNSLRKQVRCPACRRSCEPDKLEIYLPPL